MSTSAVRRSAPTPPAAAAIMAQAGSENFTVASRFLPRAQREHLLALYGYARLVDDLGDEGPADQRLELLDWLEGELDHVFGDGRPEHPLLQRLVPTVRACAMPRDPFARLIAANRQDQVKTRYANFGELVDYCTLSATPVGELVLYAFGVADAERIRLSDLVCTALQVTEHLQDVREDLSRGRVYLPQDDMAAVGCTDADLRAASASPAFRSVMAHETRRARALFRDGAPLIRKVPPRAAIAIAGFVAGGRAALDAIAAADYDVLARRPRPTKRAFAKRLAETLAR